MNVFQTFPDTIFTPKEWFLSKKGPKEGERVVRGHFHERVGDTSVLKMSLGVGPTPNLFPFPRTGHMKFAGVQLKYIVNFMYWQISYVIHKITMALNSSEMGHLSFEILNSI